MVAPPARLIIKSKFRSHFIMRRLRRMQIRKKGLCHGGLMGSASGTRAANHKMWQCITRRLWDTSCFLKRFNLKIQTTCSEWLKDALSSVMSGAVASAWGRFGSMQLDPNVDPTVIPVRQIYRFVSTLLWDAIDVLWDMRDLVWDKRILLNAHILTYLRGCFFLLWDRCALIGYRSWQ